jgi:hypothetical protein
LKPSLFGPGGLEREMRQDFDVFFAMTEADKDKFASWLSETSRPIPLSWSEIEQLADGTSLQPGAADRVLVLLRFLLTNWKTTDLSLEEIEADLVSTDFSKEQARKVTEFISKLKDVRERVYRSSLKRSYEIYGLPTIDDINLFWDIRPIFQSSAYDSDPDARGCENLITHTNVLIVEIQASPERGQQISSAFQLSEDEFGRLSLAFERVKRQLEIVKKKFA